MFNSVYVVLFSADMEVALSTFEYLFEKLFTITKYSLEDGNKESLP